MPLDVVSPTTGEVTRSYPTLGRDGTAEAIESAQRAFEAWSRTSFAERAAPMRAAARELRERARELAVLMAEEMGKPVRDGRAEAEKCAWACEHYAEHAEAYLRTEPVATDARESYVAFRPLGIVLAVMPWNFPFWQVFRFAAPALMAGNAALLKHASNVPGCALAIEGIFARAGFPKGLFRSLLVSSAEVVEVIRHPLVRAVTLTGSTAAGRAVAAAAGERLKKTVLELGGSDAYLVLADADPVRAAEVCAASRLVNGGQSCIAAKRFVVVEPRRAEFEAELVRRMRSATVGDPLREETTLGPQARRDLRDELHHQVLASVERGARCLLGGVVPEGPGAFYPPTVLTDVRSGMPAYDDELFGPVAAVIPVRDEREAIAVANDSVFGLGAAVLTGDPERGRAIAELELEAGSCFVNAAVKSDPRLPFGGVKESGYGRELAAFGIREFVNVKTVWVA